MADRRLRRPQGQSHRSAALLGEITSVNGRIQDIKDGYSLLRDLYTQGWLRTNRPYALRPVLEHYDYTIALWLARMDKFRTAQRQWSETQNAAQPCRRRHVGMHRRARRDPSRTCTRSRQRAKAKKAEGES